MATQERDLAGGTSWTPKGERTRTRVVTAAAGLVHDHGVAATTLGEVKTAAEVSGSQLYHYFADKNDLVRAVVDQNAQRIRVRQSTVDTGSVEGVRAWRDLVISEAERTQGRGGCPLGSLVGQLAETDEQARSRLATGLQRWGDALAAGLRVLHAAGQLAPGVDPDSLAISLLAALQGGLLLAQAQRDIRPLATALDSLLALAVPALRPSGPTA